MRPSIQKLYNIFCIEAENQFFNRAVIGGLDRILESWSEEAQRDQLSEETILAVQNCLQLYPKLSIEERAQALERVWKNLQSTLGNLPSLPAFSLPVQTGAEKPTLQAKSQPKSTTLPREIATTAAANEGELDLKALQASIRVLPGIGQKYANVLAKLGLYTLEDLLYYFPRRYDDYSTLKPIHSLMYGEEVTVIGVIQTIMERQSATKRSIVEVILTDGTGNLRITIFNQPWQAQKLHIGQAYAVAGRIDQYLGRPVLINPEIEPLDKETLSSGRIVPVYRLSGNITQRWLRRMMKQVVDRYAPRLVDYMPAAIRQAAQLMELPQAVYQAHFPDSSQTLEQARYRLAFDEIFFLQLGILRHKHQWQQRPGRPFDLPQGWFDQFKAGLPFALTRAQEQAFQRIFTDLASGRPMNRLLQGDVGSGKTVIAAGVAALIAHHNAQSAIMAPTSILAEQHYRTFLKLLSWPEGCEGGSNGVKLPPSAIRLLTGATPESERREIFEQLARNQIKILIGTHALIEETVQFYDLQFIVVDEQHRFGVEQRASLRAKGGNPHVLVMTATPIPRSLALTLYGDLDLTLLDELPPGRQPITTYVVLPHERERVYRFIETQVEKGKQAFIVYPLVEESEKTQTLSAVEEFERLQREVFRNYRLGLLHGRMRAEEKEAVMLQFQQGEIQVLISTPVVEVGVDVPNATVMVVEGANRFGLAQLHQFRGRVGRGHDPAYCILIPETADEAENERLMIMAQTQNGFVLAEHDLQQRGPGDFLGTRQSGFVRLRFANFTNLHLIEQVSHYSQALFAEDPFLEKPEHRLLAERVNRFWQEATSDIS
ncbi:MAG: ATP-dependent DNA helicase RecG [Anaerolineales bacterium]|nr:ATP-dependent DNA helicase RecG [Anaerolineales bacterium]MCS7246893.1 ATP-dependent DNA helicase RecG [Anaerolineales bacterium]MDW8160704.1 ATP-dependent DNA helicase RecG [Anaerolineales bacterium]MDW8445980.1 ATP-dependent DNA helicase RecG [Anaerolineales bacterium]